MGQPAADPMPPYCSSPLRPRPCRAASAARCGGGTLRSAPARSALSAFASAAHLLVLQSSSQRDLSPLADTHGARHSASRPQTDNRPEGIAKRPWHLHGAWHGFGLCLTHYRKIAAADAAGAVFIVFAVFIDQVCPFRGQTAA